MSAAFLALLTILSFAVSALAARWLATVLAAKGVLDRPNERSSHTAPTPRGGGLGILAAVVPAWLAVSLTTGVGQGFGGMGLALGFVLVAVVSWLDDRAGLPWKTRLLAQAIAVVLGLMMFAHVLLYEPGLPQLVLGFAMAGVAALVWIGFMNAFNFMDGIDGIAATEAAMVAGGIALALAMLGAHPAYIAAALTLAAACAGFLLSNWAPARIFMGDVGSIPLGFLLGFLLLLLADHGAWGAALTLPAYFGADTILTMLRRRRRGERLTEPHRAHAYQRAAGREKAGHARVVRRVAAANLALIGAVVAGLWIGGTLGQAVTLLLGAAIVVALLMVLERMAAARGETAR